MICSNICLTGTEWFGQMMIQNYARKFTIALLGVRE